MTSHTEYHALVELIEDFRAELEAELPAKLHTNSGESGADYGTSATRRTNGHPATWTGLPFTGSFLRYLGHSEQYGAEFIAAASMDEIRDFCRIHHDESHWSQGPTASLCRRLAVRSVEARQPLTLIAVREGLTLFATRKLLTEALRHAEEWREARRKAISAIDTAAQEQQADPIGETLRRQHNEAQEERVWERMRLKHPYLPEWRVEQTRRLEQHRKLGCPKCLMQAA